MGGPSSKLWVALDGSEAVVRVCGRASFLCSPDFKALVYRLLERGVRSFVLDLTECKIMDSTFLGILARFARTLAEPDSGAATAGLVLVNPNERVLELLENLGVGGMFQIRRGPGYGDRCGEAVESRGMDKLEAARTALEAHESLMQLSPANEQKFKEVVRFLAEDLKRLEGQAGSRDGGTGA